jgi:hypothetical protein
MFSIFGMVIMLTVYSGVGITLLVSFSLFLVIIPFVTYIFPSFQNKLTDNAQKIIRNLSDVSFLSIFIFILLDFLYFQPPSFIVAVFTIILARLTLSRLTVSIIDLVFLKKHAIKINTLFFSEKITPTAQIKQKDDIWKFAKPEYRDRWIKQIFESYVVETGSNIDLNKLSINWHESGKKDIFVFIVKIGGSKQEFLLKLFSKHQSMSALHEATLLTETPNQLPAPPLVIATQIEGFHCHVFDITDSKFVKPQQLQKTKEQLQQTLLSLNLATDFIDHYLRSKHMLWHELTPDMFTRLKFLATDEQISSIEIIEQNIVAVIDSIESLPLRVDIDINDQLLLASSNTMPLLVDWHKWEITPFATGILSNGLTIKQLIAYCHEHDDVIFDNKEVLKNTLELASLIKKLIANFNQQNYNVIFEEVMPTLTQCLRHRKAIMKG